MKNCDGMDFDRKKVGKRINFFIIFILFSLLFLYFIIIPIIGHSQIFHTEKNPQTNSLLQANNDDVSTNYDFDRIINYIHDDLVERNVTIFFKCSETDEIQL